MGLPFCGAACVGAECGFNDMATYYNYTLQIRKVCFPRGFLLFADSGFPGCGQMP